MPLILILSAIGLYVIFFVGPAIVAERLIFSRMPSVLLDELSQRDNRYTPYLEKMRSSRDKITSLLTEPVEIVSKDGLTLRGEYADLGSENTVIFCHGYRADPMINFSLQGAFFADLGYNLLFIDERGHGKSDGNAVTLGLLEGDDILLWTSFASRREGVKRVAVYGVSMGAYAVASVADRFDPDTVGFAVVDCGFASPYGQLVLECKRRRLPWPPMMPWIRLAARIRFGVDVKKNAADALSRAAVPIFFLHGDADVTVPLSDGEKNHEATASKKAIFVTKGAEHTLAFAAGGDEAKAALTAFIKEATDRDSDPDDNTIKKTGGNDENL